jgi:amidohydrolase
MNKDRIMSLAAEVNEEVIALRHFFHSQPEVAWKETETSKKIESLLADWGFENIRRGFRGTECGVTADLNAGAKGPAVALRADMDALAIKEANDLPYASQNEGVMHACGHDSHMAILLGAAKVLASMKEEIHGKIRFIFQPAEEYGLISGARHMILEGALDGIDAIAGLHIWSPLEAGNVAVRPGPVMASCDSWTLKIYGKGGHGAMPQDAVDPTLAASNFVNLLQTIVSREVNPQEVVVVSVGKLVTGSVFNVIPDSVEIIGTARTFNNDIQNALPSMIRRIADGVSSALRCRAKLEYTKFTPATVNDEDLTKLFIKSAEPIVGAERILASPMVMVSEDFSYYQQKVPGVFFFLGCGNRAKGTDNPHHSPRFNVDDDVLKDGVALMASFAADFLSQSL